MKKLIFSAVAGIVLCAAGFTSYKIYENQMSSLQSDLMTKNIEALTRNETLDLDDWCGAQCSICVCRIPAESGGTTGTLDVRGLASKP